MKAKQKAIKKKAPPPASTRRRPISKPVSKVKKPAGKYGAIREGLRRQRIALLKEAGVILTKDPDGATSSDVTDQAQAEVERNFILRLKEREQRLLQKIDEAVERIDKGVFGICRSCGNEIPLPRLQARPVTDLCIECKTRQENDESIRAR